MRENARRGGNLVTVHRAGTRNFTAVEDGSARPARRDATHLVDGRLTGDIVEAFFDVYNELRWGLLESVYAGALCMELMDRGIAFRREVPLNVFYKDRVAGIFRADFLVEGRLILELKASVTVGEPERRQLLNYLRITNTRVGLLLHFGPEPKVHRLING